MDCVFKMEIVGSLKLLWISDFKITFFENEFMMDFMGTLVNLWILCFKMEIVLWISDFNIATLEKV